MVLFSLGQHQADELLLVDVTVTIEVGITDHLVDLRLGEPLTEVSHDVTELGSGDQTAAIAIEDHEDITERLLSVGREFVGNPDGEGGRGGDEEGSCDA